MKFSKKLRFEKKITENDFVKKLGNNIASPQEGDENRNF
jgi:hypothetical protein